MYASKRQTVTSKEQPKVNRHLEPRHPEGVTKS